MATARLQDVAVKNLGGTMARNIGTHFVFGMTALFTLFIVLPITAHASPPNPSVIILVQPDGSTFEARIWGDEWLNGMETLEGYTIVRDPGTRFWVYAVRGPSGELVPADDTDRKLVVGRDSPAQLPRHARPLFAPSTGRAPSQPTAPQGYIRPNTGTQRTLVLLVSFNNQSPVGTDATYWSNKFFGATGSVSQYYGEVSYSNLTITPAQESYGTANDGIVGWLTLPYNHPNTGGSTSDANRQIVRDALLAADPYVNFSSFDTNGDGYISFNELHIVTIVAGYETSYGGSSSCSPSVWAHEWTLGWGSVSAPVLDGKTIASWAGNGGYIQVGEWHCGTWSGGSPGHAATIGPIVHEMGHDLGLPDMYDTDGSTYGLGVWSIMAGGSWNYVSGNDQGSSPAHPDPWSRWYEGWLAPIPISGLSSGQSIPQIETNARAYQLLNNTNGVDWLWYAHSGTGEYFLVENRQKVGFDQGLPQCGLLIWHIDESVAYDNTANANENHRLIDLEQADGLRQLNLPYALGGNNGDAGDPYPGSSTHRVFNAASTPNSNLYSGAPSNVSVTNISNCNNIMTADLQTGSAPPSNPSTLFLPFIAKVYSPPKGIYGRITQSGAPVAGVSLDLRFYNGSSWSTYATTSSSSDGRFAFTNAPSLANGQGYYVRYQNPGGTYAGRLWFWSTRVLTSYSAGSAVAIGDFDIADIPMVSPSHGATITLPYTFQWTRRPATPSDSYEFDLFDPADYNPYWWTNPSLGYVGSYTLNSLPAGFNPATQYGWDVWVYSPDGGMGGSYYYRSVTFSNAGLAPALKAPIGPKQRHEDLQENHPPSPR
jgi:M6 family metalloprotease-like protein